MSFHSQPLRRPSVPVARAALAVAARAVARTWKAWQNRRAVGRLAAFDDRALRDIGLTRGDVTSALSASWDRDPSARLAALSMERRAGLRAQARERLDNASEHAWLHRTCPRGRAPVRDFSEKRC